MRTISIEGVEVPESAFTFDGFRDWAATLGENAPRLHFWRGRVRLEVSQSLRRHGPLVDAIDNALQSLAAELDLGMYFRPPSLVVHPGTGLATEPDGFLVRWESFATGLARIDEKRDSELRGRPDMTLEVVSPSSRRKDLRELVEAYAAAGVIEYWIAEATRKGALVFRILVLGPDGSYRDQEADEGGWLASRLWRRAFRIESWTNRAGLVQYRLAARPIDER